MKLPFSFPKRALVLAAAIFPIAFRALALPVVPLSPGAIPASGAPWIADRGDGTYRNPVLFADYSDPDAIRVGSDLYVVS